MQNIEKYHCPYGHLDENWVGWFLGDTRRYALQRTAHRQQRQGANLWLVDSLPLYLY
jgi:hypothetical protein